MSLLENLSQGFGIPFSALMSVIFGLMIVSFPLGAYAVFNSNIGDDIDYTFPLEKFDIFIAGVNIQVPFEYQIGDLFSCLLYTSPSPRDQRGTRMPSSA